MLMMMMWLLLHRIQVTRELRDLRRLSIEQGVQLDLSQFTLLEKLAHVAQCGRLDADDGEGRRQHLQH